MPRSCTSCSFAGRRRRRPTSSSDRAATSVRDTVPGIVELSHGPSVSTEHLEQGYTYGLHVRFADAAARDAYLPHPAHRPLSDLITTYADAVLVFDLRAAGAVTA